MLLDPLTQPAHRTTKKKLSKLEFRSSPEKQAASTSMSPHPKTSNYIHNLSAQNSPKIPLMNFSALVNNNKINSSNNKNNGQRCPSQLDRSKEILSFENELVELLQSANSLTFQQKSAIEKALASAFDLFQVPIKIPTDPEGNHVVERSLIDVASLSLFKRIQAIVTSLSTLIMNTADANHNETNFADLVQNDTFDRRSNINALSAEIDTSQENFDDFNNIVENDSIVLQYNKRDQSDNYIAKNNNSIIKSNDSSLIESQHHHILQHQHQHQHQHSTVGNKSILMSPLLDNIDNESSDKLSPLATYNRRRPSSSSYLGSPLKNNKINVRLGLTGNDSQTRLNSFSRSSSGIDNRLAISRSASHTSTAYLSNSNMKSVNANAVASENSRASSKTSKPLSGNFDTLSDEESEFSDDEASQGGGVAGMRRSSSGVSFAGGGGVRVTSSSPFVKSHQGNGSFLSSNYKNNNGSFINGHRSRSFLADYPTAPVADGNRSRHSVQDFENASPILDLFKEMGSNNPSLSRQQQRNTISQYQFRSPVISPVHDSVNTSKFYSRNNSLLHDTSFNAAASIVSPSRKLNRPRSRTFNEFPRENSLRMGSLRGTRNGNKDTNYNNTAGNRGSFPGTSYNKAKHDYITENGHHGNGHVSGNGFKNDAYIEGFDESLHNTSKLSNNHEYDDMFIDMSKNFDYSSLNSKNNGSGNSASNKYPQQFANHKNRLKKLEALEKLKVRATSRNNSGLLHRKANGSHRHSSFQLSRSHNNVYSNAQITSSPNPSFSNFEEFVDFVKDTDYKNDNEDDDDDVLNGLELNDSFLKTRSRPLSVIGGRMISGGGHSGVSVTGTGTRSITGAVANHRRISMLQYQQQQAQQLHQQHQQYQQQKGPVSGSSFLSNNYSSNDLGSYNNGGINDGIYNGSLKFNKPVVNSGRYFDGNKRNTVRF